MNGRNNNWRSIGVLLLLLALHFYVRPRLGAPRYTPDFIAIGALTHSAPAVDISLELETDVSRPPR